MFYPWREVVADLPFHTCSLAFTFDSEDLHTLEFSDQSALRTTPAAYTAAIREIAFVSNDTGFPQVLPFTEMDWLTRTITKVQPKLADWLNRQPRRQRIMTGALPWIARAFAVLSTDEVARAREFSPQALQLLPHYEEDDRTRRPVADPSVFGAGQPQCVRLPRVIVSCQRKKWSCRPCSLRNSWHG